MQSETLISELIEICRRNLSDAELLRAKNIGELNFKVSPDSWSALECLEHLNRYGDFYLPAMRKAMDTAGESPKKEFRPGWIGDYFVSSVKPKEKLKKMKTFRTMNPLGSKLDEGVVERFIGQQRELLELLQRARKYDLSRVKTAVSFTRLVRLRLGDTLRFMVYHNLRHVDQAMRELK